MEYEEGELTNEDLIELEAHQYLEQEEKKVERTENVQKKFTVKGLVLELDCQHDTTTALL